MPQPPNGPLTKAHKKLLDEQLYVLNEWLQKAERAEAAGFDVTELRRERDEMYERLMAVKRTYFPNG